MAGIYIHIPFCKQACHYCNFHFATSLRYKNELLAALLKEIELQKEYIGTEPIETIYFGGGTPSICSIEETHSLLTALRNNFSISPLAEITLEANPDDISIQKLEGWKKTGINRLSIGVQSFFEEDLEWMNRAHNSKQAIESLQLARDYFENITLDLIYGTPQLTNEKWKFNVEKAISLDIPHLSCYALTVEPKTPLQKLIDQGKSKNVDSDKQSEQFLLLMDWLTKAGYEHYEISNFAKPGWRSRHNSSYWQGKTYLGLGPSAHSFKDNTRQWNISNNAQYIESIQNGIVPFEAEVLTGIQVLNEYIMTSLRTMEGISLEKIPLLQREALESATKKYIDSGLVRLQNGAIVLTNEGKLLAEGIAAALFF